MKMQIPVAFLRDLVTDRLHRVLALLVAMQLIQCFEEFWWEETYAIIYGVLAVTAVTELLFTRGHVYRFLFQSIVSVLFIVNIAPFEWGGWPASWKQWSLIREFVVFHAEQLHPFFELSVGTLLAVHALAWVGRTRAGAISAIVASIAAMAIADSFFPLELWHNIAWIVACGLVWLVVLHLRQLRSRHPDSWEALAERPLDLLLPAVAIISLVLLAGIFMPRAPVLLEDPYTIWTEAQGGVVPSSSGEGGVLINSGGSSGSSGSSLSGYSRDDKQIGGGFEFDYSPVVRITTSQKSYWRGETKAVYTGKGWTDAKSQSATIPFALGNQAPLELNPPRGEGVESEEVVQTVTVLRKDKIPVLFAASPASTVVDLDSGNNKGLGWNPLEWELRFNKSTKVESYQVVSQVDVLDVNALHALPRVDPQNASIDLAPYLQLPDSLPQRVSDLAAEKTSGIANDYDRAKALETFLKETYPYTNTPDVAKQQSKDVVDAFLFEIQEGYCDYFSTTFVVMARSIGLPARWVKGYSTGINPADAERARFGDPTADLDPSGAGTYTVRNADALSWAEVYFEGYGWVSFEPTSGFTIPQLLPEEAVVQPEPDTAVDAAPAKEPDAENSRGWLVPVLSVAAVLVIGALGYLVFRRRQGVIQLWQKLSAGGTTTDQRIVREMEKLLVFLGRKGLKRESHETIRETFDRWGANFKSLKPQFDGAVIHFEHARYGQGGDGGQRLNEFNEAANHIRKSF